MGPVGVHIERVPKPGAVVVGVEERQSKDIYILSQYVDGLAGSVVRLAGDVVLRGRVMVVQHAVPADRDVIHAAVLAMQQKRG